MRSSKPQRREGLLIRGEGAGDERMDRKKVEENSPESEGE